MKIIIKMDMDGPMAHFHDENSVEVTKKRGYFLTPLEEVGNEVYRKIHHFGLPTNKTSSTKIEVRSSVYNNGYAGEEKKEWLAMHGNADAICDFVWYGEPKSKGMEIEEDTLYVLIDDFTDNLYDWLYNVPNSIAIKFHTHCDKPGRWKGLQVSYTQTADEIIDYITSVVEVAIQLTNMKERNKNGSKSKEV